MIDKDTQLILSRIDVFILGIEETWVYHSMSAIQALFTCFLQHGMRNYNTWDYADLIKKYRVKWANKLSMGPSGKTIFLSAGAAIYGVKFR